METLLATQPELAVYRALSRLGIEFQFRSKMMGGEAPDFYVPDLSLAISVQGEYCMSDTNAKNMLQRTALEGQGLRVIYIDAEDALRAPNFYVEEALAGRDHSKR